MIIESYLTKAIQVFQIHSLKRFGATPRVVLYNKSNKSVRFETDYMIDITYIVDGQKFEKKNIGIISVGNHTTFECSELVDQASNNEYILIFHLIPAKYYGTTDISISKEELYFYLTCQDHFVEYYTPGGFSSGVLYQSAPFNYMKFSQETSTIIQAPKIHSSENLKTFMSLINSSVEDKYSTNVEMMCALTDADGSIVKRWSENIPPNSVHFLDLNFEENYSEYIFSYGLYALSINAVLLPLTFTYNESCKSFAFEHSLPPIYYSSEARGKMRGVIVEKMKKSLFFNEGVPS